MAVEEVFVAPELLGLTAQERVVTRVQLRPMNSAPHRGLRTAVVALFNLIMVGSNLLAKVHQLQREAQRRFPNINFDA
jgi:hypothetical protein